MILLQLLKCISGVDWRIPYDVSFRPRAWRRGGIGSAAADETVLRLLHVQQVATALCWHTSKLRKRVFQHKHKLLPGFTSRYIFDMLVYYEEFSEVVSAPAWEKEVKSWRRGKKLKLILAENPDWEDLSLEWDEDPAWQALAEKELRPRLKRKPTKD